MRRDKKRLDETRRENTLPKDKRRDEMKGEKNDTRRHEKEQMTYHSSNKMVALNSLKGFTMFLKHSRGNQLFRVIRLALHTIIIASRNK